MKLAKFFIALNAVEKGSAFVVQPYDPASENALLSNYAEKHNDPPLEVALAETNEVPVASHARPAVLPAETVPAVTEPVAEPAAPVLSNAAATTYMLTKDPMLTMVAAQQGGDEINPALLLASKDPALALAATAAGNNDPAMTTYMLTKDPALTMMAAQQEDGKINPAVYLAAKDPALAMAATGAANDNPALATYMITKDPMLAMMSQGPNKTPEPVDSPLSYIAAQSKDPMVSLGLTNNPAVYMASQAKDPTLALAATQMNNPAATYMLTKDPVLTMMTQGQARTEPEPANSALSYIAATTKDPMSLALTGNPTVYLASQAKDPGLALAATQMGSPAATYMLTKDPVLTMMSQQASGETGFFPSEPAAADSTISYLAANSKDPMMTLGLTNNPAVLMASKSDNPTLALAASNLDNPAATYMLTKDPVLTMMSSQGKPQASLFPKEPVPVNSPLSHIAVTNKDNPLMTLGLTNNPAVYLASQQKDPTLALAAANMNNPAATYMLTKDPLLTMMASQQKPAPVEPKPHNPMSTMMVNQMKNVTPALAYTVTGDPNMIMHGQWTNKNLALANAMSTGTDPETDPMDWIAAHAISDPTTAYALSGNPLVAHAVAAGKGKEVAGLLAGQSMNPMMTYALTKDPKLMMLSQQANPLLSYTALQHSPALAAVATNNPMMFFLKDLFQ
jgi:hypothetical protein